MKSLGIPRALKTLVQSCGKAGSLDNYIALNMPFVSKTVTNSMKICTIEFACMNFKIGSAKTGKDYSEGVERKNTKWTYRKVKQNFEDRYM